MWTKGLLRCGATEQTKLIKAAGVKRSWEQTEKVKALLMEAQDHRLSVPITNEQLVTICIAGEFSANKAACTTLTVIQETCVTYHQATRQEAKTVGVMKRAESLRTMMQAQNRVCHVE